MKPPLRPIAPQSRPRPPRPFSPRVYIRGRRWEAHPDEKAAAAPIDGWAKEFESLELTEEQMRTAVRNQLRARRKAGTAEPSAKKRKAAVVLPDEFVEAVQRW